MAQSKRVLIVGSNHAPAICERFLSERFETKRGSIDTLKKNDIGWSEFILVIESEHRRMIAHRFPNEYLLRRVVSLNVPESRAEDRSALESMIKEQLINHGFLPNELR